MNPIRLIPDASVALAWLLGRTDTHESTLARHLLEVAHGSLNLVPHIWPVEVANGMLRAERSQRVSESQRLSFSLLLNRLPIHPDPDDARAGGVAVFGQPHGVAEPTARYGQEKGRHSAALLCP